MVPTPAGTLFTQSTAQRWGSESHLVFACGRYEGIDQRVVEDAGTRMRVEEVSIGDYVLPGGESAALVMIEAVLRLAERVGQSSFTPRRFAFRRCTRGSVVHQAAELAWTRRSRGAVVRRSRPRRGAGGGRPPSSGPANAVPICGIGIGVRRGSARTETSS